MYKYRDQLWHLAVKQKHPVLYSKEDPASAKHYIERVIPLRTSLYSPYYGDHVVSKAIRKAVKRISLKFGYFDPPSDPVL